MPASLREVSEIARHQVPGLPGKRHFQESFVVGIRQPTGKRERRNRLSIGFNLGQQ